MGPLYLGIFIAITLVLYCVIMYLCIEFKYEKGLSTSVVFKRLFKKK